MENWLLDKFGKLTLRVHHVHFAEWPSPNPHHQLAKSQSPHCQVTKFTLASHCLHIESNLKVQIMSFISSLCPILVNDVWWNWLTKCIFFFQLIFWPWAIYVHGWNWFWWMNLTPLIGWISFVDHVQNAMTLIWMHAQWPNRMNLHYILTQSKFCRWNIIYGFISSMKFHPWNDHSIIRSLVHPFAVI